MNNGLFGFPRRPSFRVYEPLLPPLNPSTLNDEFEVDGDGVPSGWTSVGNLTATCRVSKGRLRLQGVASGAPDAASIAKALPSGPFFIVTRATLLSEGAFCSAGIAFSSSVSNRRFNWNFNRRPANYGVFQCGWQKFSAFGVRDAAVDEIEFYQNGAFFGLAYDGTDLYARYSVDGFEFTTFYQEPMTSYFTGGNLPDRVHLETQSYSGITPIVMFDFFRYFPTPFPDIGRTITREV